MNTRRVSREAIIYVVIQLIAYGIEFSAFFGLFLLFPDLVVVANLIGKIGAGLFAFLAHGRFTFQGPKKLSTAAQAVLYACTILANAALGSLLLLVLVWAGLPEVGAKVLSDLGMIVLSFAWTRQIVFKRSDAQRAST